MMLMMNKTKYGALFFPLTISRWRSTFAHQLEVKYMSLFFGLPYFSQLHSMSQNSFVPQYQ